MAKLHATEKDMVQFRTEVLPRLSAEDAELATRLLEASELGLRSFDAVRSMRPLVAAVWRGMCENNDPNRFAVESMIRELDAFLAFWITVDRG
jgi:hypothetical protein